MGGNFKSWKSGYTPSYKPEAGEMMNEYLLGETGDKLPGRLFFLLLDPERLKSNLRSSVEMREIGCEGLRGSVCWAAPSTDQVAFLPTHKYQLYRSDYHKIMDYTSNAHRECYVICTAGTVETHTNHTCEKNLRNGTKNIGCCPDGKNILDGNYLFQLLIFNHTRPYLDAITWINIFCVSFARYAIREPSKS